jgi:hypothetical protein
MVIRFKPDSDFCLQHVQYSFLFYDFTDNAGADGAAAFADGETKFFFHGDGVIKVNGNGHVVAGHHHLNAFGQGHHTGHVSGAEVELGTVAVEERGVAAALFLAQGTYTSALNLVCGLMLPGLADNLAALNLVTLGAAEQQANVVAGLALVQDLAEHLNTGAHGLLGIADTNDLDFSPVLMIPRSIRPVTTVPRPEMLNTSSMGIRKGLAVSRSGSGTKSSTAPSAQK